MTTLATVVVVVIATTVLLKNLLTNTNDAARNAIARANVTQQRPNDAATSPAAVDPIRRPAPIIALFTPSTLPSFLPAGIIFGSDRVVVILHMLNPTSTATNDTSVIISTDMVSCKQYRGRNSKHHARHPRDICKPAHPFFASF